MNSHTVLVQILIGFSLVLTACGGDGGGGNGKRRVAVTPEPPGAKYVSMGSQHACAVLKTGKLVCWGNNLWGQLGTGTKENSTVPVGVNLGEGRTVKRVAANGFSTCAIFDDGSLGCWGWNVLGQLGIGNRDEQPFPAHVELGENRTAVGVGLGAVHACAVLDDGSVHCWGSNTYGRLGDGTIVIRETPVPVNLGGKKAQAVSLGEEHTCALLVDGSVQCWGRNNLGQLGNDGTNELSMNPVEVDLDDERSAISISSGRHHTCAVLDDNSVVCWGDNEYGELGAATASNETCSVGENNYDCIKTPAVVALGEERRAVTVSAGRNHNCSLMEDNSVLCWGLNGWGQAGDETNITKRNPIVVDLGEAKPVAISSRENSSCALFEDGDLACWGSNTSGQLGIGRDISVLSPSVVDTGSETVTALSGGWAHTCALYNTTLKCWGLNSDNQAGPSSDKISQLTPAPSDHFE